MVKYVHITLLYSFIIAYLLMSVHENMTECKKDKVGRDYKGSLSRTKSGEECQRWDSQVPHKHGQVSGVEGNFCRNPDGEPEGPWCYTMSPSKRWEYCNVPSCGKDGEPEGPWCYTMSPSKR